MLPPKQAKISQKLLVRSVISVVVLVGLVFAYRWYKGRETDPFGTRAADTAGVIAAIQTIGEGKQAVAITNDGTVMHQGGVPADSEDRDVTWRPDGNAIFFSSNRTKETYTMFRWLPSDGTTAEQRSIGARSQSAAFFMAADKDQHDEAHALVASGGVLMEYDPKKPALHQVLPPLGAKSGTQDEEGGGQVSAFDTMYAKLGNSFRYAKWSPDRQSVFAVMRGDSGEVLIVQKLSGAPQEMTPRAIAAGDRVDFDIDQKRGIVYFTVQNFQWLDPEMAPEQYRKGNKITVPYRHVLAGYQPGSEGIHPFERSNDDKICFGSPKISPDGQNLLVTAGPYTGSGTMSPKILALVTPLAARYSKHPLAVGEIYEPAWSPDGTQVAYAVRESDKSRPIFVLSQGSATPRRLTADGIFGNPVFSPQVLSKAGQ